MYQIHTIEEGMQRLFEAGQRSPVDFQYVEADSSAICDYVIVNGEKLPLLTWRYSPKNNTIFNTIRTQLGKKSTLKSLNFAPNTRTMAQELFREFDLAEFFIGSKMISVMGYGNEKAANFIARFENDAILNLEISVTMPAEAKREFKHTLYTTNGLVSDMVIDNVVIHDQVHLFNDGKNPIAYTDFDSSLFGLTLDQQDICYAIYGLIDGREDKEAWKQQEPHVEALVAGALESLKTGKKVFF